MNATQTFIILAGLFLLACHSVSTAPWLVRPMSDSVPQGTYILHPFGPYVLLSPEALRLGELRGYTPRDTKTLKRIAAKAGDTYCVHRSGHVEIQGLPPLQRFEQDQQGRLLPRLPQGCHRVPKGHVFVYGDGDERSFDSRYVGPVPRRLILRRMTRLGGREWTW